MCTTLFKRCINCVVYLPTSLNQSQVKKMKKKKTKTRGSRLGFAPLAESWEISWNLTVIEIWSYCFKFVLFLEISSLDLVLMALKISHVPRKMTINQIIWNFTPKSDELSHLFYFINFLNFRVKLIEFYCFWIFFTLSVSHLWISSLNFAKSIKNFTTLSINWFEKIFKTQSKARKQRTKTTLSTICFIYELDRAQYLGRWQFPHLKYEN